MNFLYRHRIIFGFACLLLAVFVTFGMCFAALSRTAAQSLRHTVVIDAGHGGIDGGVVGVQTRMKESDINLSIARILQQEFEDTGFYVVQTRPTEAGLYGTTASGYKRRDMNKRAEIIRSSAPSVVISVHQNFFSQPSRRGAQVFFREEVKASQTLGLILQKALNEMPECVKKSEALAGDYFVLNCSESPAVIVECGFLSNAEDEALLISPEYQKKIAKVIVQGTVEFLSSGSL